MNDFTVWLAGFGTTTTVVVSAGIMYAWYNHLAKRLPSAVYYKGLETQISELRGRRGVLLQELKDLHNERDHLLQESAKLKAEIAEAADWLRKNQEKIEKMPQMRAEITELEEKHRKLRETIQQLENEFLHAKGQRIEEEEKAAMARSEAAMARKELATLNAEKSNYQTEIKALSEQKQSRQEELHELISKCLELQEKYKRLESDVYREEKRLEETRRALRELQQECAEEEKKRNKAAANLAAIEAEISAKRDVIRSLSNTVEGLTKQVESFQQTIEPPSIEKRLADFMRPVLSLPKGAKEVKADERKLFEAFIKHVSDNGYQFHNRTLWAFHASLKTADISPLVVLAGISGTGKSQLPRLYAEAMGMHFLNVAVQPRWDSPQDLFGFYNYMEHTYKATELARALRQMDEANWPDEQQDGMIQKGMLLVLLDEMNLARVEYYFSELLSKLEMRNAVGDDLHRRKLAEIEIEVGPLNENAAVRRLYVGSNVLFVGTMNEDETTQALSDKVLDRSNVLRFGKPATLKPEKPSRHNPSNSFLLFNDWKSWIKDELSQQEKSKFEKICINLNTELSKIHRPFGHRVYQAMYRYIANYPQWGSTNWFNYAMADQLEQKIIPRLRGLSRDTDERMSEVLVEISRTIDQLEDKELQEAFSEASEHPVFHWTGVNRESTSK